MSATRGDWVKLHHSFFEHDAIEKLSDAGVRAYLNAICLSDRLNTDGRLSAKKVASVAKPRVRRELIEADLWNESADGIEIVNYLKWQRSADEKDEQRRKKSAAGRLGGLRSGEARREANAEADASPDAEARLNQREKESKKERKGVRNVFNGSSAGLPESHAHEVLKLLEAIGTDADAGTEGVLGSLAQRVPFGSIAKARESLSIQKPRNRAEYAVAALRSEVEQNEEDIPF